MITEEQFCRTHACPDWFHRLPGFWRGWLIAATTQEEAESQERMRREVDEMVCEMMRNPPHTPPFRADGPYAYLNPSPILKKGQK